MSAPLDLDAVRVGYLSQFPTVIVLCDELEATRAERDRLRAVADAARRYRDDAFDSVAEADLWDAIDALDAAE